MRKPGQKSSELGIHHRSVTRPTKREFDALYQAHVGYVWRVLRRFGVEGDVTRDATQEVFVVVYRQFGTWEGRASVRSWLYGVARHVASHHHRSDHRRARKHAALRTPEPVDMEAQLGDRARLKQIVGIIEGLDSDRRRVYELGVIEGLRAPEIAEALGWKINTVYSRLRRARADVERELLRLDVSSAARTVTRPSRSHHGRTR